MVDQVGSRLCHAPGAAGGAKPAPLAAERDQLVVAAVAAAQSQEAVREDAAFEEGVELVFDELRQIGAGLSLSLREEGRRVLLHRSGTAWSVPGDGARSGPGRHPAPAGAAGQWLAREAPEVVSPHGLKPCAAPQSPRVPPTCVCPLLRGHLRGPRWICDRPLRGAELNAAYVSSGSVA